MNIYNSVLLNNEGIIERVRTNCAPGCLLPVEKTVTLYTFSAAVEERFLSSFLPFHFYIDDGAHALQELIVAGTQFINPERQGAELVIAFTEEITLEGLDFIDGWKAYAWRKAVYCNNTMIGISLAQ